MVIHHSPDASTGMGPSTTPEREGWYTVIAAPLRASLGIAKWQYNYIIMLRTDSPERLYLHILNLCLVAGLSRISGTEWRNGTLEWNTGMGLINA